MCNPEQLRFTERDNLANVVIIKAKGKMILYSCQRGTCTSCYQNDEVS